MRYIKRRTNVRQHNRQTKHVNATVRNHDRNLKPKAVIGVIPLKSLTTSQAKAVFPGMNPYGDVDNDGVINKKDCRPFDVDRQDEQGDREREEARRQLNQRYQDAVKAGIPEIADEIEWNGVDDTYNRDIARIDDFERLREEQEADYEERRKEAMEKIGEAELERRRKEADEKYADDMGYMV